MTTTDPTPAMIEDVRKGDLTALLAWADYLEELGDETVAPIYRGVPGLLQRIEAGRQAALKAREIMGDRRCSPILSIHDDGTWGWHFRLAQRGRGWPPVEDLNEAFERQGGHSQVIFALIQRPDIFGPMFQAIALHLRLPVLAMSFSNMPWQVAVAHDHDFLIDVRRRPFHLAPNLGLASIRMGTREDQVIEQEEEIEAEA